MFLLIHQKLMLIKTALNLINTNTTNNSNDISSNLTKITDIKSLLPKLELF